MKKLLFVLLFVIMILPVSATILSVDKVYVKYDDKLNDNAWVILWTADTDSEYITTIRANELKGLQDGQTVSNEEGFNFKLYMSNQKCKYDLRAGYGGISKFKYYDGTSWSYKQTLMERNGDTCFTTTSHKNEMIDKCKSAGGYVVGFKCGLFSWIGFSNSFYCIKPIGVASEGSSRRHISWNVNSILTTTKGETATGSKNFDFSSISEGQRYKPVIDLNANGKSVGYIKYVGSFVSGEDCPTLPEEGLKPIYSGGKWVLARESSVNTVKSMYSNIYLKLTNYDTRTRNHDWISQDDVLGILHDILNYNAVVDSALADLTSSFKIGTSTARIVGSTVVIDLPKETFYILPTFQVNLVADLIGIVRPYGKPDLSCVTEPKFDAGTKGVMKIGIKNVGKDTGSFDISISCPKDISIGKERLLVGPLKSGGYTEVDIPIYGSIETSGKCNIVAVDRNNPGMTDEISCGYKVVKPITPCDEGEEKCIGNEKYICEKGKWEGTGEPCGTKCNEGSTKCIKGEKYLCKNGTWNATGASCGIRGYLWIIITGSVLFLGLLGAIIYRATRKQKIVRIK